MATDIVTDIVVVGSVNEDLMLFQSRLPHRGETLIEGTLSRTFGGKGANQAVQAARLGATTTFIGAVGDDAAGASAVENFDENRVKPIVRIVDDATGTGVVHVLPTGDVYASVFVGANSAVEPDWLEQNLGVVQSAKAVVLQNEVPQASNDYIVRQAAAAGVDVFYNVAPYRPVGKDVLSLCAYLIVNEDEALGLTGREFRGKHQLLRDSVEVQQLVDDLAGLCDRGVITLGPEGCVYWDGGKRGDAVAHSAEVVDTTGAGDSFIGAFVSSLTFGQDLHEAIVFASKVAALTTEGVGAQSSMPSMKVVS